MIVGVLDTHTILWFLSGDPKLSATARHFIVNASNAGNDLAISSITLVEMVYLIEKGENSSRPLYADHSYDSAAW